MSVSHGDCGPLDPHPVPRPSGSPSTCAGQASQPREDPALPGPSPGLPASGTGRPVKVEVAQAVGLCHGSPWKWIPCLPGPAAVLSGHPPVRDARGPETTASLVSSWTLPASFHPSLLPSPGNVPRIWPLARPGWGRHLAPPGPQQQMETGLPRFCLPRTLVLCSVSEVRLLAGAVPLLLSMLPRGPRRPPLGTQVIRSEPTLLRCNLILTFFPNEAPLAGSRWTRIGGTL